jgi:hypothetical protein
MADWSQEFCDAFLKECPDAIIEELMQEYPGETLRQLITRAMRRQIQWYEDHPEMDDRRPGATKRMERALDKLASRVQVRLRRQGFSPPTDEMWKWIAMGVINVGLNPDDSEIVQEPQIGEACAFALDVLPKEAKDFGRLVRWWQNSQTMAMCLLVESRYLPEEMVESEDQMDPFMEVVCPLSVPIFRPL